jgi:DNA-binding transcriptional MerR regulator
MKVGELAGRTGLSVRTLHHYDEIGLLRPRQRTPSGHRIYGMDEVRRLQQIASLRHLGLSLEEIGTCLDRPDYSLDRVLELQVQRLRGEIVRQKRLVDLLENLRRRLDGRESVSMEDVTATIEGTLHHEKYYTPEQLEALARRGEEVGIRGIQEGAEAWARLFDEFRDALAGGLDPGDGEVRKLALRAKALVRAFTGGDAGIEASLQRMYREEGGVAVINRSGGGMDPELWRFYGDAMAALEADPEERT